MIKYRTIYDKAQQGLGLIEDSIIELLSHNTEGLTNAEIVEFLGLQSEHQGRQKNYLTFSILGNMMKDNKVLKCKQGNRVLYKLFITR
jgi:hypothetical protein